MPIREAILLPELEIMSGREIIWALGILYAEYTTQPFTEEQLRTGLQRAAEHYPTLQTLFSLTKGPCGDTGDSLETILSLSVTHRAFISVGGCGEALYPSKNLTTVYKTEFCED